MTPELEKHYERLLTLFETDGWKEFIEDARTMTAPLENIRGVENFEFRKGQLDIADWMLNYESSNRQAYKDLQSDL